jgi:inositol oxygenase
MPSVVSSHSGRELDATSDAIDEGLFVISLSFGHGLMTCSVNVIRGKSWNDESEFDENLDKSQFRDYEAACDRVKAFYKEQHGLSTNLLMCLQKY